MRNIQMESNDDSLEKDYEKTLQVIESCTKFEHLATAGSMIKLFEDKYPEEHIKSHTLNYNLIAKFLKVE